MAEQKSGIGKTDAVRQAMAKVGADAGRDELHKFVKEQLRVEIAPAEVSKIRGKLKRRMAKATKKPAAKVALVAKPAPSVAKTVAPSKGVPRISLADIATAKDLLSRSSAADLKRLFDLLAG